MNRLRKLIVVVVVVALAGGVALAQGPRAGGPGGPGGRGGRGPFGRGGLPLAELQLTDAQKEQVREIRSRHESQIRDAESRLETARRAQMNAVEAVPADETKITALTQDLTQAEVDAAIQASRLNTEIWSVLTPEQQTKLKELRAQRQSQNEQRRGQFQQRRRPQ
jgi:protein CpxP